MGRPNRTAPGGWGDHVLNRANARMPIFTKDQDFIAFETVLAEAVVRESHKRCQERMALSQRIQRFGDLKIRRSRSVEERDPSRS